MGFSNRHNALLNLVTTVSGITTDNGYANTVASVYKHALDWVSGRAEGALPAIGVLPLACQYEHISPAQMRLRQDVAVEFAWSASDDDDVWGIGDSLVDDIVAALLDDRSRGGYALGTEIVSAETDQGNPDTMDSSGGTAAGVVRATIILQRQMVPS